MSTLPSFTADAALRTGRAARVPARVRTAGADVVVAQQFDGRGGGRGGPAGEALVPPTVCTCPCCQVAPCYWGLWTCVTCC